MTILSTGAAGIDVAFDVDWLAPLLAFEMYACCAHLQKPESEQETLLLPMPTPTKARMDVDIIDGRCWDRRRIRRRLVGAAACIHRFHPLRR